jgi:electron transfer flavoprotein alpha subunit
MGPPQAEEALRVCLALGADRCIHLSDRLFAVADTLGTSRTLAMAIQKDGADLVVCGKKTLDSETWQVPPEVAAFLGWGQATNVAAFEATEDKVRARRIGDEGEEVYELDLPAVCSVAAPPPGAEIDVEPTPDGEIAVWTAADLVEDAQPGDKRFGQTGSPTRVLAVRDVSPERKRELLTDPAAAATRVRELLTERPAPETAWDKPERLGEKPGASYDCWSVVETVDGRPARVSLELIAKGRELAGKLGGKNVALVLGHEVSNVVGELLTRGAEEVVVADDPALAEYEPGVWASALEQILRSERPHVLLIPATSRGRDYGPRAAGARELGMTGDCVGLGIDKAGRLIQTKPAYGGNIVSVIMGATTPQLATVRPRMFEPLDPRESNGSVRTIDLDGLAGARSRLVEHGSGERAFDLDEADTVIAAGAGVGDAMAELREAAGTLGAAVGGDRSAVEAGLVPPSRQLGLLGRAVAPRLYVAVETEGDFEHAAASVKAAVIVVFKSSNEPVTGTADVAVAGDWRETLPVFASAL